MSDPFFINDEQNYKRCLLCGLFKGCKSPHMEYSGHGKKGILILGEASGSIEDKEGIQLIGPAGQLLRNKSKKRGLLLDRDCWKVNALGCRPPNNRPPTKKEIKLCKPYVDYVINTLKPKFIWLMGNSALESMFMGMFTNLTITRWRGRMIPWHPTKSWLVPMFHPSYVLRNEDDLFLNSVFDRDLDEALFDSELTELENPFPINGYDVDVLAKYEDIIYLLEEFNHCDEVVFDYETSGLRPYNVGHRIYVIGIASQDFKQGKGYAFPFQYPKVWNRQQFNVIKELWGKILRNTNIKKVAQAIQFESLWTRELLEIPIANWHWDTMVTQHIIDDRQGATGLDFQSFVRWGIRSHDSDTKKYVTEDENGFNKLHMVPVEKLCEYCGTHAHLENRLWKEQIKEVEQNNLQVPRDFYHKGNLVLSEVRHNGICTDVPFYEGEKKRLDERTNEIKTDLFNSDESRLFLEKTGKEILLTSTKDLSHLLFDILNCTSFKKTLGGKPSVDEETLTAINIPFTKELLKMRHLQKIKDVYLEQFLKHSYDGKIHPSINLHLARSFRSSYDSPNLQNTPVRDDEAKRATRSGIIPSLGNKLLEVDFSGLEFRIAACWSRDEAMVQYIVDGGDPHRDFASKLFLMPPNKVTKDLRFYTKNQFVFPEIYGSYYKPCAMNLWDMCLDLPFGNGLVKDWLKSHGFDNQIDFIEHVKRVEKDFWSTFFQLKMQQDEVVEDYLRTGYVEMFLGFRRGGYLKRNEILNTPVQGPAFFCLLWSLIQIHKKLKQENFRTKIIAEIHDSILFDLHPEEENEVVKLCKRIMCYNILREFDWLIVPLDIEFEISKIDGNWYEMEKLEIKNLPVRQIITPEMRKENL